MAGPRFTRPLLKALKAVKNKVFVIQGASLEANYKGVFSSNLGVDYSALKSWVNVFSSVFSPKTNSILFRLLCKLTKLSARSVEQEVYWFKSSALLRSKDFGHYKNKARCRAKQRALFPASSF